VRPLPTRSLGPTKQFTLQCCLCLCFSSMVATTRSLGSTRQFSLQLRRKFAKLCCCEIARSGQPISRHFVLTRRLAYFDFFFAVRAVGHQRCTRPTSDLSRVRAYFMSQRVVWPGAENPRLSALKQLQCRSVLGHLAKVPIHG